MRGPDARAGGRRASHSHSAVPAEGSRAQRRQLRAQRRQLRAQRKPLTRGGAGRLSLGNWPVSRRLSTVIVVALVMGVVFGALRIASAASTATGFARTTQLAVLGEQVASLAQAMETRAKGWGFASILCNTEGSPEAEADYVQMLLERQVVGMIFISSEVADLHADHDHYRRLLGMGARLVFVNGTCAPKIALFTKSQSPTRSVGIMLPDGMR